MLGDPEGRRVRGELRRPVAPAPQAGGRRPGQDLFPGFDDTLREAMRRETERYFAYILRGNRSVLELLDSDYAFLNERLAQHYGIEGVPGASSAGSPWPTGGGAAC